MKKLEFLYLGGSDRFVPRSKNSDRSSNGKDSSVQQRGHNHFEVLPLSFSELERLERLDLRNLRTLNQKKLFRILFNLESKKYKLYLNSAGITSLPEYGWKHFFAGEMYLLDNVIDSLPENIVRAPYLNKLFIDFDPENGTSLHLAGKNELMAYYEHRGFIEFEDIPKGSEMAEAYLKIASGYMDSEKT